ncbi:MATE family efflux transporter [Frisingicoccus caecimuris]|uniref:Putative MATE family efflux protein n=1 Tax=Frisingicoccus caecimuris TaxID=1796636 RepID=A0A4R2M0Z4_9FIRM|nr:MATE family efflux transporter [Frisingicoccus caecimuris]MCR1917777.1 MATE family efflux transporter [Frisingicoccus caecimuris]TCO86673.1 putative MATE family efflux protein [Frisingicoccus caecimuris]
MDKMTRNSYLFKMSLPIFVELLLQLLVGNIDQIMVSHYSQASVAAIVNGNQIMNIIIITMNMLSMATTVVLTQCLGAEDDHKSNQLCVLSMMVIGTVSVLSTCVALFFNRPIFRLMNIDSAILHETCLYLMIVGGFSLVQGLYLNFAAILRSHTRLKEVMAVSILMNVLNIIGNAILINGLFGFPRLGIVGAAISTVISKTIGLVCIYIVFRKYTKIKLKFKYLKQGSKEMLFKLLKIGIPSGAENFSYNLSQICILSIINPYGAAVTATKGYCSLLANFAYVYAIAISEAVQIVIGYLLGSGKVEEVGKKVWWTLKISIAVCVGMMFIIWLFSPSVLGIFTQDGEMLALGRQVLFIDIFLEFGRAINILMTKSLISVGEIKLPICVGISFHWAVALLLSYIFGGVLHLGLQGIWVAMAIDECSRGLIYFLRFRTNKWKKKYIPAETF